MENDSLTVLNKIAQAIFDKKGFNILCLDLRGVSTITDFVIIAEGSVDRHVVAIAKNVLDVLSEMGIRPYYVEGLDMGDWVAIDLFGIMVHLFMPSLRERYRLELLWKDGKIVDLEIDVKQGDCESYS